MKSNIQIVETLASQEELIHITEHGHCYVNPYCGCSEGCPFCYWEEMPGWSGRLEVRMNACDLLESFLAHWDHSRYLYIGSYCNPYETLAEPHYRLTRQMLERLRDSRINVLITTSTKGILEDLEILRAMNDRIIVVLELSRLEQMKQFSDSGHHEGIETANELRENGLTVWTTLSPYLPGISDLQAVLDNLRTDIPIYVSALDVPPGSPMHLRIIQSIRHEYPELEKSYDLMIRMGSMAQLTNRILDQFASTGRVRCFPYPLP